MLPSCAGARNRTCSPSALLASVADVLRDVAQSARASGAPLAATHVMAAVSSAKAAQRLLAVGDAGVQACGGAEPLRSWCGDPTMAVLLPDPTGPYGQLRAPVTAPPPAIAAHDLGWELLASEPARGFASDAMSAALLARTLAQTCWVDPVRRSRWSTSMVGAVTVVRLLRGGMAFPILDPAGTLIHGDSAAVAASLGWRPALGDGDRPLH